MLPELKAKELVHNEYYAGDKERADGIRARIEVLKKAIKESEGADKKGPPPPAKLPAGWEESRTPTGDIYYYNSATGDTSWVNPGASSATGTAAENEVEMQQLQAALREASTNQRKLEITLYLTGEKRQDSPHKPQPQHSPPSDARP